MDKSLGELVAGKVAENAADDIEIGSIWCHHSRVMWYKVLSIGPIKIDGVWLPEPVVTYYDSDAKSYNRFKGNFLASFTRA